MGPDGTGEGAVPGKQGRGDEIGPRRPVKTAGRADGMENIENVSAHQVVHGVVGKLDQGLVGHLIDEGEPVGLRCRRVRTVVPGGCGSEPGVVLQQTGDGVPQLGEQIVGGGGDPAAPPPGVEEQIDLSHQAAARALQWCRGTQGTIQELTRRSLPWNRSRLNLFR